MPQLTTSAKTLLFYVETKAVKRLGEVFGDKLQKLAQEEKYQLCTAIALMLWGCCDSGIGEGRVSDADFGEFMVDPNPTPDLISASDDQLGPEMTGNVRAALVLLQNEEPEILAQLLPAVAEYARDDDR